MNDVEPRNAREIALVERTKRLLHRQGCKAIKTHGSALQQGIPDIIGSFPVKYGNSIHGVVGVFIAIEMKRPGYEPTEKQYRQLYEWRQSGAIAFYSSDPDEVVEIIRTELLARFSGSSIFKTNEYRPTLKD